MQQLVSIWSALPLMRRVLVVAATLAMFLAVLAIGRMATTPGMALLYSGLEEGAAGQVVAALEQQGVTHEVRGSVIYVPQAQRDQLRMTLASEGLPANTGGGYELLDRLSGFSTTSQMFDAAYWRAKEGELARTIASNPRISAARVHIANVQAQPFRREISPTASVTVTAAAPLDTAQARALRYLVASAVPGLGVENVSVIDSQRGLVLSGEDAATAPGGLAADRAEALRRDVLAIVERRVGAGNAVVSVNLETVTERESLVERTVDPKSRVLISSDTEERSANATDSQVPAVGVASNLPEGEAAADGSSSRSQDSSTRERANYDISAVERQVERIPGGVKRVTVAVLLDGVHGTAADGTPEWTPLPEPELASLRNLVASAVGYDESRGDLITLESMPLDSGAPQGTEATASWLPPAAALMPAIQLLLLGLVALAIGLFVLKPILTARPEPAVTRLPSPPAAPQGPTPVLTGEIEDDVMPSERFPVRALAEPEDTVDPVARLRKLISDRQHETVEILRNWMEEKEEKA